MFLWNAIVGTDVPGGPPIKCDLSHLIYVNAIHDEVNSF
jgi:hypothetical protein